MNNDNPAKDDQLKKTSSSTAVQTVHKIKVIKQTSVGVLRALPHSSMIMIVILLARIYVIFAVVELFNLLVL